MYFDIENLKNFTFGYTVYCPASSVTSIPFSSASSVNIEIVFVI